MSQLTLEKFLKDVSGHEMQVIRDDGVYRHIRFSSPLKYSPVFFELVTWPGHLCYWSNMGTYMFSGFDDMLELFSSYNKYHWADYCAAEGLQSRAWEFDDEEFIKEVKGHYQEWVDDHHRRITGVDAQELWREIETSVLSGGGKEMLSAAQRFSYAVDYSVEFTFNHLFEGTFERPTWRFEWCCQAIAWGLKQYDAYKASVVATYTENVNF